MCAYVPARTEEQARVDAHVARGEARWRGFEVQEPPPLPVVVPAGRLAGVVPLPAPEPGPEPQPAPKPEPRRCRGCGYVKSRCDCRARRSQF